MRTLLGEALAAAALLAGSLKFSGTLTLQLRGGNGLVSMLIAQATSALTLRGVAHVAADKPIDDAADLRLPGRSEGSWSSRSSRATASQPWQGIVLARW